MVCVEKVEPLTEAFEWCWRLRREVLLDPFSIPHDEARTQDERATHFGILEEGRCLAVLMMVPYKSNVVRMRQVAVAPDRRREGLGRRLILFAEESLRLKGFDIVFAYAREPAVPFYQSLGYHIVGSPLIEVGLPHRAVEKTLKPLSLVPPAPQI